MTLRQPNWGDAETEEDSWKRLFDQLQEVVRLNNGVVPGKEGLGPELHAWVLEQRGAYRAYRLSVDCSEALESVPGWSWRPPKGPQSQRSSIHDAVIQLADSGDMPRLKDMAATLGVSATRIQQVLVDNGRGAYSSRRAALLKLREGVRSPHLPPAASFGELHQGDLVVSLYGLRADPAWVAAWVGADGGEVTVLADPTLEVGVELDIERPRVMEIPVDDLTPHIIRGHRGLRTWSMTELPGTPLRGVYPWSAVGQYGILEKVHDGTSVTGDLHLYRARGEVVHTRVASDNHPWDLKRIADGDVVAYRTSSRRS